MFSRRLKTGYFALEALNSFATVYYFYYLYFFMQKVYGFGNKTNLMLAALNGASYALFAWWAGKFAQRYGYFNALKLGFAIMIGALAIGSQMRLAGGHIVTMVLTVLGMSFTWPTLEALISEGEPRAGLQHMVGIYNVVWAATAAVANFSGGAMLEELGLHSLFYVPIGAQLIQLGLTLWLESEARPSPEFSQASKAARERGEAPGAPRLPALFEDASNPPAQNAGTRRIPDTSRGALLSAPMAGEIPAPPPLWASLAGNLEPEKAVRQVPRGLTTSKAKTFLRMAWLANPFAYIGINTLIAVIPGVARRLDLTTMTAGFCCSVWCFSRVGAFVVLWLWDAWHYRFRWLLAAYVGLIGSFSTILLAPNLVVLISAQLLFGVAVGLIYYSSLFYSMDSSDTKGEHGGIHEAVIGLGNFAGPAVGAAALQFLPQYTYSGALAVTALLLCGLGGLTAIWRTGKVR